MCSPLQARWIALRIFLHVRFFEEIWALQMFQKKEELLFCEICDPMGPRALGPNMAFLVGISRPHKRP